MVVKLPKRPRLPMVGMRIFSIMLDQVSTVFSGQEQLPARASNCDTWCADIFIEAEARNGGRIFITTELKTSAGETKDTHETIAKL